jgi:hypothetical protein
MLQVGAIGKRERERERERILITGENQETYWE